MPTRHALTLATGLLLAAPFAQADVKPDAGDYTALPKGTDVVVLYQQNPRGDEVYSGGHKVADNLARDDWETEGEEILFGTGFGIVTDIQTGPDGALYLVGPGGSIRKIWKP